LALGLAALVWFLVRVVPKPSRAAYPCQRAAFPLASAFVLWLAGVVAGGALFRGTVSRWKLTGVARAGWGLLLASSGAAWLLISTSAQPTAAESVPAPSPSVPPTPAQSVPAWSPSDPPNKPVGVARGLHPGRVTWIRDLAATPWDGTTGHWWDDDTGVRQDVADRMLSRSLLALTGAATDEEAWARIFRHTNRERGRGDVGYAEGERIAFKINCNNAYAGYADADNQADASPQSVLAMVRQLVKHAGVPADRITVYEAVRVVPDRVYTKTHREFPGVVFVDSQGDGTNGRQPVEWQEDVLAYSVETPGVGRRVPRCVRDATYLVNMALLKGHPTTGVTLTAKNHYGTVDVRDHRVYANSSKHPMGIYHPFVDMIGSSQLGGKTLLFMIDGLYGLRDVNDDVAQHGHWKTLFGGEWLASYFLSLDPIAIDSVGLDFLAAEFPEGRGGNPAPITNADNFLHEGARADAPPSGTAYHPNGRPLASLGVHEHWNNATARQYSRDLGTGEGIELYRVEPAR